MAESIRPPVAIRIVRPYATEEELLEHELETIGKTSVVLIGAHPRPTGVILRFEVTLESGASVLRGEGRVLAHKDNAFRGQPGLTLRFTRLDPRSKAVVDRATAMRGSRSGEMPLPSPSRPALVVDSPVAQALSASTPPPAPAAPRAPAQAEARPSTPPQAQQEAAVAIARAHAREQANAAARANARRTGSSRPAALTPPPVPVAYRESAPPASPRADITPASAEAEIDDALSHLEAPAAAAPAVHEPAPSHARAPASAAARAPAGPIEPPPDRGGLLGRLRERASQLTPERVEEILAARR